MCELRQVLQITQGDRITVPEYIKIPESLEETVNICQHIFDKDREEIESEANSPFTTIVVRETDQLVPQEYTALAKYLEQIYEKQCETGESYTMADPYVETVFQQLQIVLDKMRERTRVNTVGLYAPSYVDALATASYMASTQTIIDGEITGIHHYTLDNRYLGFYKDLAEDKAFIALLLGCSSITSAHDFTTMVRALNPEATPVIIDNDPVAVALSRTILPDTIEGDVLTMTVDIPQADLIATNFLITSMPKSEQLFACEQLLKNWAEHIYPQTGRLVLVEQMTDAQVDKILELADILGYKLADDDNPRTGWGKNRRATRYKGRDTAEGALEYLATELEQDAIYKGGHYSDKAETDIEPSIRVLVFARK